MLKISDNGIPFIMQVIMAIERYVITSWSGKLIKTNSEIWKTLKLRLPLILQRIQKLKKVLLVSIIFGFNILDIWRACRDGDLDLVRILIREG